MNKPAASLSLDLDNLWSYMKTHGDAGWESYPTYLPEFAPIIVDWLKKHSVEITFFTVGQDAAREENHGALRLIADAGHEFGNHSFNHEPWMQGYDEPRVIDELVRTHEHIEDVTGQSPSGFRGPGFCNSRTIFNVLHQMGYEYDASILPTCLGPAARLYYMWGSGLSAEERKTREGLFGNFTDGFKPLRPFEWTLPAGRLVEIPVTTIPVFRTPFHLSYIIWLSRFSASAAMSYLKLGFRLCLLRGVEPSYLLHPLDFLGREDAPQLSFFPGMDLPRARKLEIADRFIEEFKRHFEIVPMSAHAREIRNRNWIKQFVPVTQ